MPLKHFLAATAIWFLLGQAVYGADPSPYVGFDPLDWSIEMQELPAASYLLQDRYLVYIAKFRIARFQVTEQLYHSVMQLSEPRAKNKPIVRITWVDAVRFCNELSKLAGLEPAYSIRELRYPVMRAGEQKIALRYEVAWLTDKNGYRLLTEAEWEYAARGGRTPDGETPSKQSPKILSGKTGGFLYSGSNTIDNVAWYDGNAQGLQEVGKKEPNEIGLYDMSGNAWDWLWDRYIDLGQSSLARRERLEPGSTANASILRPEALQGAYRSEGRNLGSRPDEPSVRQYVREYLVWRGYEGWQGEDLRVCRGGAWNFSKVHSEIMQRSPCIAEADYYVSVSFRLAQSAE